MFKNLFLTALLCTTITLTTNAQQKIKGNRNVTIVETMIDGFNKIVIPEDFDIVLTESNEASVEIETDENLHNVIRFQVTDSILSFKTTANIRSKKKMEIIVRYTPDLNTIEVKDNAEVSALNTITPALLNLKTEDKAKAYLNVRSHEFNFVSSGKSKAELNVESLVAQLELNDRSNLKALVNTDSLTTTMYMHSNAKLEGTAKNIVLSAISSSNFTGENLTANHMVLTVEDRAKAIVNTTETITVNASGSSTVQLYGKPKISIDIFTETAKFEKKQ